MAIKDWRIVPPIDLMHPIGDPYYANPCYMAAFCALEIASLMRMTDDELAAHNDARWSGLAYGAHEYDRREAL